MYLNETTTYALEQNAKLQKMVDEYERRLNLLQLENEKLQNELRSANQSNKKIEQNINKLNSNISYLARKQREADFDWDIGY